MNVFKFPANVRLGRKTQKLYELRLKFLRWQNPDVDSIISTRRTCICAWITSDFHQRVERKKKMQSDSCDLKRVPYFIPNLGLPSAETQHVSHVSLHSTCVHAVCADLHSKTWSGWPVLIIGLSVELAKVPYLAIVELFPNDGGWGVGHPWMSLHACLTSICALIDCDFVVFVDFTACCGSLWGTGSVWFHWPITTRFSGTCRRAPRRPQ